MGQCCNREKYPYANIGVLFIEGQIKDHLAIIDNEKITETEIIEAIGKCIRKTKYYKTVSLIDSQEKLEVVKHINPSISSVNRINFYNHRYFTLHHKKTPSIEVYFDWVMQRILVRSV